MPASTSVLVGGEVPPSIESHEPTPPLRTRDLERGAWVCGDFGPLEADAVAEEGTAPPSPIPSLKKLLRAKPA